MGKIFLQDTLSSLSHNDISIITATTTSTTTHTTIATHYGRIVGRVPALFLHEAVWRIANCAALRQNLQPRTSVTAPLFYDVGHRGQKLSIESSLYYLAHKYDITFSYLSFASSKIIRIGALFTAFKTIYNLSSCTTL